MLNWLKGEGGALEFPLAPSLELPFPVPEAVDRDRDVGMENHRTVSRLVKITAPSTVAGEF